MTKSKAPQTSMVCAEHYNALKLERDQLKSMLGEIVLKSEAALSDLGFLLNHQKTNLVDGSMLLDGQSAHELLCALNQTPEQCLLIHDAEVLESVAIEMFSEFTGEERLSLGSIGLYLNSVAATLRSEGKGNGDGYGHNPGNKKAGYVMIILRSRLSG